MKKKLLFAILILSVLAVSALLYFSTKEYSIKISNQQLQEKIDEQLPITQSYLLFLNVTLDNPNIVLKKGTDKIDFSLDVKVSIKSFLGKSARKGTINVSGGIRYEPEQGHIFLTKPSIDDVKIEGLSDKYKAEVIMTMSKALDSYFKKNPIYTLDIKDLKQAAAKQVLKDIQIKDEALVITLGL